jgi:saccharopine dehydrogenase-like NADP-dependent oxidoreductase
MKKVLIIGAGAQGGPCTSILSRDDSISEILLADIDLDGQGGAEKNRLQQSQGNATGCK